MKFIVSGKGMEVTDALKQKAIKKLSKLDKFFNTGVEAYVTMSVEKSRHIVEVTIPVGGIIIRAEMESPDMYGSIDLVVDKLESQIKRNKARLGKRFHAAVSNADILLSDSDTDEEYEYRIVKMKKLVIKPMPVEEAILQMNLLGHEFFLFINSETGRHNVVYRRKDGDYGLLESGS